ncbi:MAG: asparagine synthase (glutamine-hydrolyzing), partial [Rhodospirillaceae bacterium]|nr:asparagine synthase (glutamine-hydrolyzing) [Rhodospirillaceae bacterium]
ALRADLEARGVRFTTASDTEVLLKAFIAEGPEVFARLDGMFAVAIYDTAAKVLTLARDRAGEKPLYTVSTPHYFAFASELRPLLSLPGFDVRLSADSVALYLALRYVPAPRSLVEGIAKLEPGCVMQVDAEGRVSTRRYFNFALDDRIDQTAADIAPFAEEVEAALQESLTNRLNSDVPLGAFLSSGIDSALVCAILTRRMNRPVKTYTVGFADDPESEHAAARSIAAALGTEHHDYIFGAADFDRICDDIGTLLDEPNGDRSCVPTYLLSQFARQHVTVTISGDGGDELFAGYGRYAAFVNKHAQAQWPNAGAVARAYFEQALPVMPWPGIAAIVPDGAAAVPRFADGFGRLFAAPGRQLLHALRVLDFESYLPGAVLAKVDRMSMRHGLEVRTPYLAPALFGLSGRASLSACVGGGLQKAVLRRLAARYLPEVHVRAPKKGFGMPKSVFLNNIDRVRTELQRSHGILAETGFFRARAGSADALATWAGRNINAIWATIVLAKWVESVGLKF